MKTHIGLTLLVTTFAGLLAAASPAAAQKSGGGGGSGGGDAMISIDQSRALTGGITANDTPGFPVTLSQPGHYRLTGDLVVDTANQNAIWITADDVTLDLNGFTIRGPVTCTGSYGNPVVCAPAGATGSAVFVANDKHFAVRNGTLRGFATGVYSVGGSGAIEGLQVRNMLSHGIYSTGRDAVISNNVVSRTAGTGIRGWGLVRDNVVNLATQVGIAAGGGAMVVRNKVHYAYAGIQAADSYLGFVAGDNVLYPTADTSLVGGLSMGAGNTNICGSGGRC